MTRQEKNKMFSVGFAFLFSVCLALLPVVAVAAGLVPCGGFGQNPCTWCDLLQLAKNVIDFLMYIIFPLAAIVIVWGGIVIMTARDSAEKAKKGRAIITAAVVGILIALLSWLILDTIFKVVAVGWDATGIGPWNQLKCQ